ncbi:MAG TPA: hypothetical protein VIH28_07040 [Ignavibacteriaceae bacterium]
MKTFKKYLDAEKYAMELSAKRMECISIVHLFIEGKSRNDLKGLKRDFTVIDTKDEWSYGIDFVMNIKNFETPFELSYISPKVGRIYQNFPTKESRDVRYKELIKENFFKYVYTRDLTPEQYFKECVEPYHWSNEISNSYRQTLISQ